MSRLCFFLRGMLFVGRERNHPQWNLVPNSLAINECAEFSDCCVSSFLQDGSCTFSTLHCGTMLKWVNQLDICFSCLVINLLCAHFCSSPFLVLLHLTYRANSQTSHAKFLSWLLLLQFSEFLLYDQFQFVTFVPLCLKIRQWTSKSVPHHKFVNVSSSGIVTSQDCNQTIDALSGLLNLTSILPLTHNVTYVWCFNASVGDSVFLHFVDFGLAEGDVLRIHDGSVSNPIIGNFTGSVGSGKCYGYPA